MIDVILPLTVIRQSTGPKYLLTYLLKLLGSSIKTVDTLVPCGDRSIDVKKRQVGFTETKVNKSLSGGYR